MNKISKCFITKSFLIMLLLVMAFSGSSQNQKIIFDEQTSEKHGATIISERSESVTIKFNLNELDLHEVNTQNGAAYTISSTNAANVLQKGYPDLFYLAQSIIIPNKGSVEIESITGNYEEFNDIEVAPSKGNLKRNVDPNQLPFEKGKIYQVNEFYPKDLANLREPFILRDFRGQSIQVNPVQYNPVTKTLRVYKDLTINVKFTDGNGVNELTGGKTASSIETEFAHVYSSMFLNFNNEKYTVIGEDGELLIICYDDFVDTMQPFVNWKRTIGRNTTIVPVSEVGSTSAAIKTYIQNYYENPENNLTHVLLVGDAPQIPTNSISNGDSDNYYGYLEGTDSYSEIIIGRFSAETIAHVETQVQRMIEYERDMTEEDTWLNVGMGIARNEGSGGGHNGGEADYEHMNFIRDTLLNYTYVEVHKEYDGGVPGETNTTPAEISAGINDGLSVINYCNHGLVTGWSVAGYSSSHVDQLTNTGKLPYIWAVACVNGDFVTNTCFAETWLRATHNGEPSGAIGTMMSTINQAWQPPMTGQDEMVGILSESFEDNIKRTYGGISINGSMKMLDLHGASGIETHDTWTLFGDPTLLVRTDVPQEMNVSHNPTIFLGSSTFSVTCDTDGAEVIVSYTDETGEVHILATADVQGGSAELVFENEVAEPLDLTVAVVGYNKVTYLGEISAVPADEPYIVLHSYTTSDSPDFGQLIDFNIVLKNISEAPYTSEDVTAKISTENNFVTINSSSINVDIINPGEEMIIDGAFSISIDNSVPDQTPLVFDIEMSGKYNGDLYEWSQTFSIKANAPKLSIGTLTIDDSQDANGDGVVDAGETADLNVKITNDGNADVGNLMALLSVLDNGNNFLTVESSTLSATEINVGDEIIATYKVTANEDTPQGTTVNFIIEATAGLNDQYKTSSERQIIVGFVPEYCTSSATSPDDSDLIGVLFGELVNYTEPGGTYDDFTDEQDLIHDFMLGGTYDIEIELGTTHDNYSKGAKVFIDWNYDGDFTDQGETVLEVEPQNASWVATGTVVIPTDAPLGPKYMRVIVQETSNLDEIVPCGTYNWGGTEDYKIVLVAPKPPVAEFDAYPKETKEGDVVSFTDLTNNAPTSWKWNVSPGVEDEDFVFVEETSTTSRNPKVQFFTPNDYTIELIVNNSEGSDTMLEVGFITISEMESVPEANFSIDQNLIYPNNQVVFTDQSTNIPIHWEWTISPGLMGDDFKFVEGTDATSRNPVVAFSTPGFYSVTLTATNTVGASTPYSVDDIIEVQAVFIMTDGSFTTCDGTFFDTGGSENNYMNNENYIMTFFPGEDQKNMRFEFLAFNVEEDTDGCWDEFEVYDGPDTNAPVVGSFCGTSVPQELQDLVSTHETGAITFKFKSDEYVNRSGWEANISCVDSAYDVMFTVFVNETPVEGATVTLDGYGDKNTNVEGELIFSDVSPKEGLDFVVTHQDYNTYESALNVFYEHVYLDVMLTPLSLDENLVGTTKVYPNPFEDYVNIISSEKISSIHISNIIGQRVLSIEKNDNNILLSTQELLKGTYLLTIISKNGNKVVKKIIKK